LNTSELRALTYSTSGQQWVEPQFNEKGVGPGWIAIFAQELRFDPLWVA
jgi:hypothetical protein